MSPIEAAKQLELPENATPEQLEARFNELRAKLEEKIGKAPTPGLKAKYRESLDEITQAFEVLTLAADSSALPVLQKQSAKGKAPGAGGPATPPDHSDSGLPATASAGRPVPGGEHTATGRSQASGLAAAKRKSGGMEFAIVAVVAIAVLAAGGWWVMKTREENAEKARVAAEARAEAERKAAADKLEQERRAEQARVAAEAARRAEEEEKARVAAEAKAGQERRENALALLRSRLAQLNVQAELLFVDEPTRAARRLSELKSDERALSRDAAGGALARVRAQLDAQQAYVDELEALVSRHPARSTQAQAAELVSARALDPAAEAVELLASQLDKLDTLVSEARQKVDRAIYGSVLVENTLDDVEWTLTDAFGDTVSGRIGRAVANVGIGTATITFARAGWPEQKQSVLVRRGAVSKVTGDFRVARIALNVAPAGASYELSDGQKGTVPAAIEVIPGVHKLSVQAANHYPHSEDVQLGFGEGRQINVTLKPEPVWTLDEIRDYAQRLTNWAGTGIPYTGTLYSLSGDDGDVMAVVCSALPVAMTAPAYPRPDANHLVSRGQTVPLYIGIWQRNAFQNLGTRANNPQYAPVDQTLRPNCGGVVHLAGMLHALSGQWIAEPSVFATSNPALASAAQRWVKGVKITMTGPAPSDAYTQYRVIIAVRFRAR